MTFLTIAAIIFLCSALMCGASAPLWAWGARKCGLVDNPGERKIHAAAVPYGGGIAIMAAILLTVGAAYAMLTWGWDFLPAAWRGFLTPHMGGLTEAATLRKLLFLLCGAGTVFVLGIIDDFRPLPPRLKLAVQILAAFLAWYGGVRVVVPVGGAVLSCVLTVGWIVGITNAFNLLDNMDGLAAGVALCAGISLFGIMSPQYYFTAALISAFCGALAGFLPHNFSSGKRKIFMGDAGALFVGFFLATLTIAGNYFADRGATHALLMPLILLGVPLFDTLSVMFIRWRNRRPLMVGDTNHLSHRLVRRGYTRLQAVGIIYLLSVIFGLLAQLLAQLDTPGALITFAAVFCTVALMAVLMRPLPDAQP